MLLAGDAGGTKTRFALYEQSGATLSRVAVQQYPSSSAPGLAHLLKQFLTETKAKPNRGCIGIPGPVVKGFVKTPNLPWEIKEQELGHECGISQLKLVNDLVATTAAVPHLSSDGLISVYEGSSDRDTAVCAVLAPGTGTGQGFICSRGGKSEAFASEGGHVDFAPTNEIEDDLLVYLRKKVGGRVSVERVLCGPGISNIYEFLRDSGLEKEPAEFAERLKKENPGAAISQAGLKGEFDICVRALDVFTHALGAYAGNLVLTYMATGGLYLGGGVPPKLAAKLVDGTFVKGYLNKGRFERVVKTVPVNIIKDDHAALIGAASIASGL